MIATEWLNRDLSGWRRINTEARRMCQFLLKVLTVTSLPVLFGADNKSESEKIKPNKSGDMIV